MRKLQIMAEIALPLVIIALLSKPLYDMYQREARARSLTQRSEEAAGILDETGEITTIWYHGAEVQILQIGYGFEVDGVPYRGIDNFDPPPEGREVTVYYVPEDPTNNAVFPDNRLVREQAEPGNLIGGMVVVSIVLLHGVWLLFRKPKPQQQTTRRERRRMRAAGEDPDAEPEEVRELPDR